MKVLVAQGRNTPDHVVEGVANDKPQLVGKIKVAKRTPVASNTDGSNNSRKEEAGALELLPCSFKLIITST